MNEYLCLQTTAQRESKAAGFLRERGIETYAPQTIRLVRLSPRKVYERVTPLFPAYFFAEADSFHETRERLGGIVYPFRLKSQIVGALDASVINEIRVREQSGIVRLPNERKNVEMPFERNERVIINSLSIVSVEAIFQEHIPEKKRVLLLMKILGRQQVVPFHVEDVSITSLSYAEAY